METNPFRAQRAAKPGAQTPPSSAPGPTTPASGLGAVRPWVTARVAGQKWFFRAPLLLVLAWILKRHLSDPMYSSIFSGLNLGFHEAGHAAFMWFGNRFLSIAGGTIFEVGVPAAAGLYLLFKQRDPFGAAVCVFWLGTALVGAGLYAADARAQVLPLVSPFGPVDPGSHDWSNMLMKFGKLSKDQEIGGAMQSAGKLAMTVAIILSSWILRVMATSHAGATGEPESGPWDAEEDKRLDDFASGKKVTPPHDSARRRRMTEEERFKDFIEDRE